MPIPQTFTNYATNPAPAPNGLGAETRRNLIPNPVAAPSTSLSTIRRNENSNPSWEFGDWKYGWPEANFITPSVSSAGATDGTRSVQLQPTGAGTDSFIGRGRLGGDRIWNQIPNGTSVTISATVTVPRAFVNDTNARARAMYVVTGTGGAPITVTSPKAPNAPGTYRLSMTVTPSGDQFFIRLYNGSNNPSDIVYWDSVLVQINSTLPMGTGYFDGASGMQVTNDGDLYHSWDGKAHDSLSSEQVRIIPSLVPLANCWARHTTVREYAGGAGAGCASVGFHAASASMAGGAGVDVTLPAATQHTFSAYVFIPAGVSAPSLKLRASGPGMTTVDSATAMSTTGSWQRMSITFTTVTAGVYNVSLRNFTAVVASSGSVNTDGWQLETGAAATSFFSGNSSAPNLSYQWTGTPSASPSTETGLAMPDYVGVNANIVAAEISGKARVGIIPVSASTDSKAYVGAGPGGLRTNLIPGKTYFLRATLQLTAALTGTAHALNTRNVTVYTKAGAAPVREQRTASSPNAVGTYTHTMWFTVPGDATEAYISLNNGHPTGGGTVFWDQVMITEGDYTKITGYLGGLWDPTAFTLTNSTLSASNVANVQWHRITPSGANDSFAKWHGKDSNSPMPMGIRSGRSYTISGQVRLPAIQTGTLHSNARRIVVVMEAPSGTVTKVSNQAANVVGTTTLTASFQTPADMTAIHVRLYNGAATSGGVVEYTNVSLQDNTLRDFTGPVNADTNMIPNGDGSQGVGNGIWVSPMTVLTDELPPGSSTAWSVPAGTGNKSPSLDSRFPVTPGGLYVTEIWVKASVPDSRIYFEWRDADTNSLGTLNAALPGGDGVNASSGIYPVSNTVVPTVWTKFQALTTVNAGVTSLRHGTIYFNHTNGTERNAAVDFTVKMYPYVPVEPNTGYFDGNTGSTYQNRVTRWLGAPNASPSQNVYRGLWIEGNANFSPPRVTLTAAGLGLNSLSRVTIRRLAGGDTMAVPGWVEKNVLDIGVGIDWLVPLNTNVQYQLWVDGVQIDTATIQFTSPCAWVADPLLPGDAMPIYTMPAGDALQLTKAAMGKKSYSGDWDSVKVIGAKYPVARSGGRTPLTGMDLSMNAPSNVTSDQFFKMIQDNPVLCIRTHPSWGNVPPILYLMCDATEAPVNRQRGGQFTVWEVSGDAVAPMTRGPITTTVTHAEVQAVLAGRTHQAIQNISSAKRWADILADPLSLGE